MMLFLVVQIAQQRRMIKFKKRGGGGLKSFLEVFYNFKSCSLWWIWGVAIQNFQSVNFFDSIKYRFIEHN
jgi:hypothetical protein